jgi:hypothetical protein
MKIIVIKRREWKPESISDRPTDAFCQRNLVSEMPVPSGSELDVLNTFNEWSLAFNWPLWAVPVKA